MTEHNHPAPLGPLAGTMGEAFAAFDDAVFNGAGEIPRKYRELIALAVALTTQCDACLKGMRAQPSSTVRPRKSSRRRPTSPPRCAREVASFTG